MAGSVEPECEVCGAAVDPETARCPYCRTELAPRTAVGGYSTVGALLVPVSPVFLYGAWITLSTALTSLASYGPLELVLVVVYGGIFLLGGLLGPGLLVAGYVSTRRPMWWTTRRRRA